MGAGNARDDGQEETGRETIAATTGDMGWRDEETSNLKKLSTQ